MRSPSSTRYRMIHYLAHTVRMLPAHSPEFFALLAQLAVEQHPDILVATVAELQRSSTIFAGERTRALRSIARMP